MIFDHIYRRRRFLSASVNLLGLLAAGSAVADPATGIDALDTAATGVRLPGSVLLVAITRAGNRLVAVGQHGVITYSDDSGQTWLQGSVPVNVTLTCVSFITPLIGWAAGNFGVVLKTEDGGATWREQLNGIQANQLTLAAATDPAVQASTAPGAPIALRRAKRFVADGPNKPFLSMFIFAPQKVIVFGSYKLTMRTLDGGMTWQDWSLRIADRFSHNLYAVTRIGAMIYVAGEEGLVFCSNDEGDSFVPVTSPSAVTLFGALGAKDGSLVVFGVAGAGFRSIDAGKSWVAVNFGTQDNLTAGRVLPNGALLVAGQAGALFLSHDNGASFQPVSNVPPLSIFDFQQAPDGSLVFVGGSGAVNVPLAALNV